jgi:dTDP-4-amino-4,6-dideoxygalactose transaminase
MRPALIRSVEAVTQDSQKMTQAQPAAHADAEPIYFARPSAQYQAHAPAIDAAIRRVLNNPIYIMGEEVRGFEEEFARFVGVEHAVGVANGTDALQLALRAYDIGPGDEVITTAHTAVATIAAIDMTGATPRFVDILPDSYGLDPDQVARAIGPRTKAILPVHIYGHPVEMGPLVELAERKGVVLIEDCAQAHGARWQGRLVGSIGQIGCFSCYPTKNLGAIGDAGIVTTHDANIAEKLRLLRQYGWRHGQVSEIPGYNSRLDELQAAILRVKLPLLEATNAARRRIAARYSEALSDLPLVLPSEAPGAQSVFHLCVLRAPQRDRMKAALAERGIIAGIHYPMPAHKHPAYVDRFPASLPVTERVAGEILSLPMYPELTDAQIERVIEGVRLFHRAAAAE